MLGDVAIRREFASRISDNAGKPVEKPSTKGIFASYLSPVIRQYFATLKDVGFDQDIFNALYLKFEEYVYADSLKYNINSPLSGFISGVDVIELGNKLKIRKMREEEKDALWKTDYPYGLSVVHPMDALSLEYTLEKPFSHKKASPMNTLKVNKVFEGVVTALRLFKTGNVDFFFTITFPITWSPYGGLICQYKKRAGFLGLNYVLKKKCVDDFIVFWKKFRDTIVNEKFYGHDYLRIALKRFNLGLEEKDNENKVIDFFVAFEALYLRQNLELSYRLALRTATFLGATSQEKKEIFKFMRDAYILRSQIIHGKPPKIRKQLVKLQDYVSKLENYLRRSIVKFLEIISDFKNQEKILISLDQEIFR